MRTALCLTVLAGLALVSPAQAQGGPDDWRLRVPSYLLVPAPSGETAVRGSEGEVDPGPDGAFSPSDRGFLTYHDTRHDAAGLALDAISINLAPGGDDRVLELDVSQAAWTPMAFVRAAPNLDVYVGARVNDLGADFGFEGPLDLAALEQDETWVDPLVGARFATPLGGKWSLQLAGDVGGFGVGSDIAVSLWPALGYALNDRARLGAGYRVLYMDYRSGSGADRFAYDVLSHGPVIGAAFDF